MKQPVVSVIIPNYNYAHYLPLALDSVFAQTYPHLEIVVVDDGSQDASEDVVRKYGGLRLIRQINQGVSAARNRGVQETKGELLAFLDADDVWAPTKIAEQVSVVLQDPDIGLVHCGVEEIDPVGNVITRSLDGMAGWVSKEMLLFQRPVIIASGSTALVPRTSFDAVGGFDTRLSTSADWELGYRLAVRQRVGFVKKALVQYRIHGKNMHANVRAMEHDVLIGYAKAFDTEDPELLEIRRQCYARIHSVLAASYYTAGHFAYFARHALRSIMYEPRNLAHLIQYSRRRPDGAIRPDRLTLS